MIEATVVEVELNDENQAGINWAALSGSFKVSQNNGLTSIITGTGAIGPVDNALTFLQRFGNSQVLSSPKVVGLNNQPTVIKVVKNLVYFTTSVTPGTTTPTGTTQSVFSTTPNTVPVGLVMSVLPSIDQHDKITLIVRPTISDLVRYVVDPNPEFTRVELEFVRAGLPKPVSNSIPEIQEREMESVLKLNDGQVAVLGG